jgi:hypothetical protein
MNLTWADLAAVTQYPELRRLILLRDQSPWRFLPKYHDGELELVTGVRVWPGSWTEAVAIRSQDDVKAFRCDPAGGEVWGREGGLAEVLDSLIDLPAPHAKHAPILVKARAPRLWVPTR